MENRKEGGWNRTDHVIDAWAHLAAKWLPSDPLTHKDEDDGPDKLGATRNPFLSAFILQMQFPFVDFPFDSCAQLHEWLIDII